MKPIIIYNKQTILRSDNTELTIEDFEKIKSSCYVDLEFTEKSNDIYVLNLKSLENLSDDYKTIFLREYFFTHSEEQSFFHFRARALAHWHHDTKFCSVCGTKLNAHETLTAKECPSCKKIFFPKIEPCIIVLVKKGDKILLVKHAKRNQDFYACIAGFIEAGESAENAVKREVKEEVGINIKNIQYKGSQSWPFPTQLMFAFTAEYESGELKLQEEEIAEAKWFLKGECPKTPYPGSIGYRLINGLI